MIDLISLENINPRMSFILKRLEDFGDPATFGLLSAYLNKFAELHEKLCLPGDLLNAVTTQNQSTYRHMVLRGLTSSGAASRFNTDTVTDLLDECEATKRFFQSLMAACQSFNGLAVEPSEPFDEVQLSTETTRLLRLIDRLSELWALY